MSDIKLDLDPPKVVAERIALEHDPKQYWIPWLARRGLAKLIEKELKSRELTILNTAKKFYGEKQ